MRRATVTHTGVRGHRLQGLGEPDPHTEGQSEGIPRVSRVRFTFDNLKGTGHRGGPLDGQCGSLWRETSGWKEGWLPTEEGTTSLLFNITPLGRTFSPKQPATCAGGSHPVSGCFILNLARYYCAREDTGGYSRGVTGES